jgi:amidophosphoribosyltransferase
VRLKLNPIREILKGKRVIMVDDSIVRGTTSKKIVRMLREAGASEVHMLVTHRRRFIHASTGSTPQRKNWIAARMTCRK